MKKLLLLPALLAGAAAFGQYTEYNINYGITANIHQSNIKGIHWNSKGRTAPSIGVFAHIPLQNVSDRDLYKQGRWVFQPQLEYSMDGERNKPETGDQKYNVDFISLPLYIKYYFAFNKVAPKDFFVQAGPQFGFVVADKATGPSDAFSSDNKEHVNYVDHHNSSLKKSNFGISLGAGYTITDNLAFFVRYDHGFSKAYDNYSLYKTYHYKLGAGLNFIIR